MSRLLDGMGGISCEHCNIAAKCDADAPRWSIVEPHACDDEAAARLCRLTEKMIAAGGQIDPCHPSVFLLIFGLSRGECRRMIQRG